MCAGEARRRGVEVTSGPRGHRGIADLGTPADLADLVLVDVAPEARLEPVRLAAAPALLPRAMPAAPRYPGESDRLPMEKPQFASLRW